MLGDRGMLEALRNVASMGPAINEMTHELRLMRSTLEQTITAMELVADRLLDVQQELRTSLETAVEMRDELLERVDDEA